MISAGIKHCKGGKGHDFVVVHLWLQLRRHSVSKVHWIVNKSYLLSGSEQPFNLAALVRGCVTHLDDCAWCLVKFPINVGRLNRFWDTRVSIEYNLWHIPDFPLLLCFVPWNSASHQSCCLSDSKQATGWVNWPWISACANKLFQRK